MHQKLWISDRQNIYVGSVNMDWKSLAQVKELGIYVESPALAEDLTNYFNQWIQWARLHETEEGVEKYVNVKAWSWEFDVNLTKPCWSKV